MNWKGEFKQYIGAADVHLPCPSAGSEVLPYLQYAQIFHGTTLNSPGTRRMDDYVQFVRNLQPTEAPWLVVDATTYFCNPPTQMPTTRLAPRHTRAFNVLFPDSSVKAMLIEDANASLWMIRRYPYPN